MIPTYYTSLGKRIRQFRTLRGMTQRQLGERIGSSYQQLQKFESAKNHLRADQVVRLAEALSVSPLEILTDSPTADTGRDDLMFFAAWSKCTPGQKCAIAVFVKTLASEADSD